MGPSSHNSRAEAKNPCDPKKVGRRFAPSSILLYTVIHSMLFNSFDFIFLFLPIVLLLYYSIGSHYLRLLMLLAASYYFYSVWNYKFLFLLFFSTGLDFYLGIKIHDAVTKRLKKRLLILSIFANLGVLGFFKYFNFFAANFYFLAQYFSQVPIQAPQIHVALPIGISFYTFISLSYTIDVYRGHSKPHRNFFSYAGFVAFFPHLVAGPLIRHNELVHQLEDPRKGRFNARNFSVGLIFFLVGLAKKMLIADRLAAGVNPALARLNYLSSYEAVLCALGYTFQIYFDFSGYSDMAVGLAKMMNIDFPQNFRSPYKSCSITEFWQRWHITLSQWLRDYLYIPLGGNRGSTFNTYRNLFLTMLIGGLWHGANWVFIVWGCYHGLLLALERAFRQGGRAAAGAGRNLLTFVLVVGGWIFFRSPNLGFAGQWLSKIFLQRPDFSLHHFDLSIRDKFMAALVVAIFLSWGTQNLFEKKLETWLHPRVAWVLAAVFFGCLAYLVKKSPFLYFEF
jgi:alginate O-acetyltransferase complex protein AlgI